MAELSGKTFFMLTKFESKKHLKKLRSYGKLYEANFKTLHQI